MSKSKPKITIPTLFNNPVFIILIVAVLLIAGYFGYLKYQDWNNERFLRDFSGSYVRLVADIENATGTPLEITTDCLITQEKYGGGKGVCGVLTAENVDQETLTVYQQVLDNQDYFRKGDSYRNGAGYHFYFRGVECDFNYQENIWLDCVYPIRDANRDLAAELLNEERLNQRKDEILQELQNQ